MFLCWHIFGLFEANRKKKKKTYTAIQLELVSLFPTSNSMLVLTTIISF